MIKQLRIQVIMWICRMSALECHRYCLCLRSFSMRPQIQSSLWNNLKSISIQEPRRHSQML